MLWPLTAFSYRGQIQWNSWGLRKVRLMRLHICDGVLAECMTASRVVPVDVRDAKWVAKRSFEKESSGVE